MKCSECNNRVHARGFCHAHYMQWWRGSLGIERLPSFCTVCSVQLDTARLCRNHWLEVYKNSKPYYSLYRSLLERCYSPKSKLYPLYGAKGITVAQDWRESYYNFEDDMWERPKGARIKRKDPKKGFSSDNCYWG